MSVKLPGLLFLENDLSTSFHSAHEVLFTFSYKNKLWVQNKPPQDEPQWYADYFELKATLAAGSRETLSLS